MADLSWYSGVGVERNLTRRCPFASVYRCPRHFQSVALLGGRVTTSLDPTLEGRLTRYWEQSDLWPVTDEQATSVMSADDRPTLFSNFCPEVTGDIFGVFATHLGRYADEIDSDLAHRDLAARGASSAAWRWAWASAVPLHYSDCALYSALAFAPQAIAESVVRDVPLYLRRFQSLLPDQLPVLVRELCNAFKRLVEHNRLGRLIYNDDGGPRAEKIAQLTFFAVSALYCNQNNIDVSPEADAGAGSVDFKLSQGANSKVVVEVKLSSNSRMVHGFEEQLPEYGRAENTDWLILLIIQTTNEERYINSVEAARAEALQNGQRAPEIVRVDARPRPSASKRESRRKRKRD